MKKFNLWMTAVILTVCTTFMLTSCSNNDEEVVQEQTVKEKWADKQAKYTIMLYGCGGSDVDTMLDDAMEYIVQELNVPNNQVRFVVMYSYSKDNSKYIRDGQKDYSPCGEWATTYRYEVDPSKKVFSDLYKYYEEYRRDYKYKPASEVKLYDKETLKEYILWAKQTAPADNYIFMPMNHGGGFTVSTDVASTRGIAFDDNHDNACVSTFAIADALKETNTHLKAIYWYGCLMGQLEVLTEEAPYCDYQFCSSHVSRVNSNHIVSLIKGLNSAPDDMERAALNQGGYLNENYTKSFVYNKNNQTIKENCDFACWRSDKVAAINTEVKKMADLVLSNYTTDAKKDVINLATSHVYLIEKAYPFVDVLDYVDNLASYVEDADINAKAQVIRESMKSAIGAANVYHIQGVHRLEAGDHPMSKSFSLGISIYAEQSVKVPGVYHDFMYPLYKKNYKASAFDKATGWSSFLDLNTVPVLCEEGAIVSNPSNDSSVDTSWFDFNFD